MVMLWPADLRDKLLVVAGILPNVLYDRAVTLINVTSNMFDMFPVVSVVVEPDECDEEDDQDEGTRSDTSHKLWQVCIID